MGLFQQYDLLNSTFLFCNKAAGLEALICYNGRRKQLSLFCSLQTRLLSFTVFPVLDSSAEVFPHTARVSRDGEEEPSCTEKERASDDIVTYCDVLPDVSAGSAMFSIQEFNKKKLSCFQMSWKQILLVLLEASRKEKRKLTQLLLSKAF